MTGKEDLFTPVHKGLRAMLYDLSSRLQTNDFADRDATAKLAIDLENDFAAAQSAGCILCAFAFHAEEEEAVVFPSSARVAQSLVSELIQDHHGLTRRETEIGRSMHELVQQPSSEARIAAGIRVNQLVNELIVAYLAHMNREETELVPVMREHFSDGEQAAMRGAIIAKFPREQLFALLGWMLPALNVSELSDLLGSLKGAAPPPLLKAVSDLCGSRVEPARWAEVRLRVGI